SSSHIQLRSCMPQPFDEILEAIEEHDRGSWMAIVSQDSAELRSKSSRSGKWVRFWLSWFGASLIFALLAFILITLFSLSPLCTWAAMAIFAPFPAVQFWKQMRFIIAGHTEVYRFYRGGRVAFLDARGSSADLDFVQAIIRDGSCTVFRRHNAKDVVAVMKDVPSYAV